ncbi:HET-domain-containing protein, partial [Acephala macrosclerotiorum]
KLIDCKTRRICLVLGSLLEGRKYAALSYVWGLVDEAPSGDHLPENVPLVIEDALRVVRELDIGYLWVDRYCIDQTDEADKEAQFKQMDAIYSSAYITIFAAAGNDPHHGLPGVSRKRNRNRQPCARVGGQLFTWTMPDGSALVLRSKWNTRAWTYQEMVFSGSRLIFTDYQVYLE